MDKKLFLIDGHALLYRSYYAFIKNPRYNSKGLNTSAVFGFINTIEQLIESDKPEYMAVSFDVSKITFRNHLYSLYKANRVAMPDDMRESIPYARKVIEACNIPIIEMEGFEADDVIGTIAKRAEIEGFTTYMFTPDKDYCQLVTDKTILYKPSRVTRENEYWDVERVKKEFGVRDPKQVIDILALWGDSSDNIPGAPGIGEKTSKILIEKFGSVENIFANIDQLQGKQKDTFLNNKEQIELSKVLATIVTDVPVEFKFEDLKLRDRNTDVLTELYKELEFNMFIQKMQVKQAQKPVQLSLFGDAIDDNSQQSSATTYNSVKNIEHNYVLVDTDAKIKDLISKLEQSTEFCFDTETTSVNPVAAALVGIAFCVKEGEAYFLPCPMDEDETIEHLKAFKHVFEDESKMKIGQNIKYDMIVLANYGIEVKGVLFDTMVAHYLINSAEKHNLDFLALKYFNYDTIKIEQLIGKNGQNQLTMRQVSINKVCEYSCEDADITYKLKNVLKPEIDKEFSKLFYEIEMPLVFVLAQMELNGVKIDKNTLKTQEIQLKEELSIIEKEIYSIAGGEFNISSPKQLGQILFDRLKIASPAKTKTEQYSTSEETLSALVEHKIVELVLRYRGLNKLLNTYIETLPTLVNAKTLKIHTSYNQAIVETGRLSSNNPNLQNIPIKNQEGKRVREAFIPSSDEYVLVSADYSQVELRIIAALSGDDNMISAFINGKDIHAATAANIYKVSLEDVTPQQRNIAKIANFSIIYGVSSFGLAQNIKSNRTDAKQLIDSYFESYPKIKQFMDASIQNAYKTGFVETLYGHKQRLDGINSNNSIVKGNAERNAINTPIQGTSADIIKMAMIRIHNRFKQEGLKSKMIMQVHDELDFDVYKPELEKVKEIVKSEMEMIVNEKVKLTVDISVGENWANCHK